MIGDILFQPGQFLLQDPVSKQSHLRVKCGIDGQSFRCQYLFLIKLTELLLNMIYEVRSEIPREQRSSGTKGLSPRFFIFQVRDHAQVQHPFEHQVAPVQHGLGVSHR